MRFIWTLLLGASFIAFSNPVVYGAEAGIEALLGEWSGPATHAGDSAVMTIRFAKDDKGDVNATFDLLRTNIQKVPLGKVTQDGNTFKSGPFEFHLNGNQRIEGQFGKRKIHFELEKDAPQASLSKLGPPVKTGSWHGHFRQKVPFGPLRRWVIMLFILVATMEIFTRWKLAQASHYGDSRLVDHYTEDHLSLGNSYICCPMMDIFTN
jgi:hypothetical protein